MYKLTAVIPALLLLSVIQTGCKKPPAEPPKEPACRILHLSSQSTEESFQYNSHGDPLTISVTNSGTGNPNVLFLYDQYHRLTDFVEPYKLFDPVNPPDTIVFELWIKYTYADKNPASLPIVDTTRSLGRMVRGVFMSFLPVVANHYTYDARGRVVKFNDASFIYDSNGNLVLTNNTYDNKKNFRTTNKIWMFIDRNYSANNAFTALTYNSNGFPLTMSKSPVSFIHRFLALNSIDYSCDVAPHPKL